MKVPCYASSPGSRWTIRFLTTPPFYFGSLIKMLLGFEVAGLQYPKYPKIIRMAAAGQRSAVDFSCVMNLQSCVCSTGRGLWSNYQSNEFCRVMDTLVFRVSPALTRGFFGIVNS
jgi:hypothetical protein